ncbi:hypothetical protein M8818_003765 [Zalaria obscura]|uniref:Uncharacterized protein n=1 Tax=Zalaria obscura TaxID=2024903 RepID=A0ACC3SDU5_9PEZI
MSSRLLSMKFMQRSGASTAATPSTPEQPPSKRQRLSTGGTSPVTPSAEEQKRIQALERQAALAGETKWVLSYKDQQPATVQTPMRIVTAGYSTIDSRESKRQVQQEEDADKSLLDLPGRRSFGKFNRKLEKQQNPDLSSSSDEGSSDSEADSEDDMDEGPTDADDLISQARREAAEKARAERKAKRKAEKAESLRLAAERRAKEVKLNRSSGRISTGGRDSPNTSDMTCFECGQKGHSKRNCPRANSGASKKRRSMG